MLISSNKISNSHKILKLNQYNNKNKTHNLFNKNLSENAPINKDLILFVFNQNLLKKLNLFNNHLYKQKLFVLVQLKTNYKHKLINNNSTN